MKRALLLSLLSLTFAGAKAQQLPNTSMESWRNVFSIVDPLAGLEAPEGWYGADSLIFLAKALFENAQMERQLFKTTDKHSGTNAAKLVTVDQDSLGIIPGVLSNAQLGFDLDNLDESKPLASLYYTGGTPVNQRVTSLKAYTKYQPQGQDKASILIQAVVPGLGGRDSVVGSGSVEIAQAQSQYTLMTVPVTYTSSTVVPTKVLVLFLSSSINLEDSTTNGVDGSILYVDDVNIATATGIELPITANQAVSVFPNPSQGTLSLSTSKAETLTIKAFNLAGQPVATHTFNSSATLNLSHLPSGIYTYQITDKKGSIIQRNTFSIVK